MPRIRKSQVIRLTIRWTPLSRSLELRRFVAAIAPSTSRVREIARKLREAGIDAWFDEWEIKPGDDIVAAMNRGLASYDVGRIFFSNEVQKARNRPD